ncbi:hypothetical protein [Tunicatimonas pelagia]|uniref:hypothetical protein n=1 Tax=Tunicatimonas pelagia TaxID=931531 RepID=UPI00266548BB|nr:hypothetical protein [Tunicatimonas pelagia]WKN45110.1 hypothetical protein P0M28_09055 [Tunicatimonas pelagia]
MKKIVISAGLIVVPLLVLHSQSLDQDPLIHYYFDEEEMDYLQSLIYFFDRHVTQDCNQGVAICLSEYADSLADTMMANREVSNIFDNALLSSVLDSLSPKLFSEIWYYGSQKKKISSDSIAHYWEMDYRTSGRYFDYLSASSYITDTMLKHYVEPAKASGTMSSGMVASLLLNHNLYNLNDERNRLIFTIHCITLDGRKIPQVDRDVLRVKNTTADSVRLEIWMYSAEGYENNRAGAFDAVLPSQQSFILNFDGLYFSEKGAEISPASPRYEQEGFEVVVYRSLSDKVVIYGDTPKDTLATERFSVQEIIEQSPTITIR